MCEIHNNTQEALLATFKNPNAHIHEDQWKPMKAIETHEGQ